MGDNVEIIRGAYDALARGDVPSLLDGMDEKIEWTEAAGFPYAGTYIGPDAVVQNVLARLGSEWEGFSAQPDLFVGQGDNIVVVGWYSGKYNATGKSMRARFAHVWEVRDDKAVRFEQVVDSAPVQEAVT